MTKHIIISDTNHSKYGFTLIELLVSVAIIGIITAVAIPSYIGYIDSSRATTAKNNLRNIYLQQQEYFTDNNIYYSTGATCTDSAATINTNIFNGQSILDNTSYTYCILQTTTADFTAHAQIGSTDYTLNNNNVDNF